tara:strand:- start:2505 stop:2777 length:273 start_codon:yes stop_codon:yes gene_type:complete
MASVAITSPTSSSSWQANTTQSITWTASVISGDELILGFSLYLYNGNSNVLTIATGIGDTDRSYSWSIPSNQTADTDYRIKIVMNYQLLE